MCIACCALVGDVPGVNCLMCVGSWLVYVARRVRWCALLGVRWLVRVGRLVCVAWCALVGASWSVYVGRRAVVCSAGWGGRWSGRASGRADGGGGGRSAS